MSSHRYVFTTSPGAVVRIDRYGKASNDVPAIVPDVVGDELDGQPELVVSLTPTRPPAAGAGLQKPRRASAPKPAPVTPADGEKEK